MISIYAYDKIHFSSTWTKVKKPRFGAWLKGGSFVLEVWGIISNKQNMKIRDKRDFLFFGVCSTNTVLAKDDSN